MAESESILESRKVERYDPTQPLQLIKEEDDNVWQEETLDPTTHSEGLSVESHYDDDGGSPLERLVKSISGEDEVWPIEDESSKAKQDTRGVKTYYDPTINKKRGEFDSSDEVNTSGKEKKEDFRTITEQTPVSVALYRLLFGKKQKNTEEIQNQETTEEEEANEDVQHSRSISPVVEETEDLSTSHDTEETDTEQNDSFPEKRKEVAVNLPILLLHKIKKVFEPRHQPAQITFCPLCGQDLSKVSYDDFKENLKKANLWRVTWIDPNAEVIPTSSQNIYKTELKIDEHGNRSLTEAFYGSVAEKKRFSVEI